MMMNVYRDEMCSCYFHPKEIVVGVCALCLNERLLVVASSRRGRRRRRHSSPRSCRNTTHINLSKILPFTSFITRLQFRHWKTDNSHHDHAYASTSHEQDSFISINFEKNGAAAAVSWEKNKVSEISVEKENCSLSWNQNNHLSKHSKETKTVIERDNTRALLRWRKRIGQLFQLIIRRKPSNNKATQSATWKKANNTLTRSTNNNSASG